MNSTSTTILSSYRKVQYDLRLAPWSALKRIQVCRRKAEEPFPLYSVPLKWLGQLAEFRHVRSLPIVANQTRAEPRTWNRWKGSTSNVDSGEGTNFTLADEP